MISMDKVFQLLLDLNISNKPLKKVLMQWAISTNS